LYWCDGSLICVVFGNYANMLSTDSRPGYFARLRTPYINTTGMCLELYFQSQSTSIVSKSVISIIVFDEEKEKTVLASTEGLERTVWDRLISRLPSGVHQVVVEGRRSSCGYSSMSVDDVVVKPCENFGNSCLEYCLFLLTTGLCPSASIKITLWPNLRFGTPFLQM